MSSFAALGLPPYLTVILPELGDATARWAGVLYVVPTVFGALGAPLWGRLADRFGRKRLLLRAQLGLSVSFLLAGWATAWPSSPPLWWSRACSAAPSPRPTATSRRPCEGPACPGRSRSCRAAPGPRSSPHRSWSASLSALGVTAPAVRPAGRTAAGRGGDADRLSEPDRGRGTARAGRGRRLPRRPAVGVAAGPLFALEFVFVFATVISFPYLITLIDDRMPGTPAAAVRGAVRPAAPVLPAAREAGARRVPPTSAARADRRLRLYRARSPDTRIATAADRLRRAPAAARRGPHPRPGLPVRARRRGCGRGRAPGEMFGPLEFVSKGGAVAPASPRHRATTRFGPSAPVLVGGAGAAVTAVLVVLAHCTCAHAGASSDALPASSHQSRALTTPIDRRPALGRPRGRAHPAQLPAAGDLRTRAPDRRRRTASCCSGCPAAVSAAGQPAPHVAARRPPVHRAG